MHKKSAAALLVLALLPLHGVHAAESAAAFAARIDPIVSRPEFRHAFWGSRFSISTPARPSTS